MSIFMKVPQVSGNSTAEGYNGWIELQSMDFSIHNSIPMQVGRNSDRDSSYPSPTEVLITKVLDPSSNKFFEASCTRKIIGSVEIHICSTDNPIRPYMKYTLDNVLVSDYQHTVVSKSRPMEMISLNYTELTLNYSAQNNKGQSLSPQISGYNLATAKLI